MEICRGNELILPRSVPTPTVSWAANLSCELIVCLQELDDEFVVLREWKNNFSNKKKELLIEIIRVLTAPVWCIFCQYSVQNQWIFVKYCFVKNLSTVFYTCNLALKKNWHQGTSFVCKATVSRAEPEDGQAKWFDSTHFTLLI